ncbi:DUF4382 domain-containing protein [Marinobacter lacisalsi]|uniref:DUF4382 domain-containing protein n=1 Tax=Marinobacter lacisalsi TaxID=475979 RepID=A0ABV8QKK5_9GAMM
MKYPVIKTLSIATLAAAVAACGGSGSGGSDSEATTGTASLSLTDAPTGEFSKVVITFTGVILKPADGEAIEFPFDQPRELDLLTLQNGETATLLDEVEVAAGEYSWIRLTLDEDNLYVVDDSDGSGGQKTLAVPSGAQTGLKLVSGFTVAAGGTHNFTIDFDARKSIVNPQGNGVADYFLKPALRLVNNLEVGAIVGEVDYGSINQDENLTACDYEGSVYVYEGTDVTPTDLNVNTEGGPLMSVPVNNEDQTGLYDYKAAFLPAGDYTLSYSCQHDDNEQDDTLEFLGTQTVTVVASEEATAQTIPLAE